MFSHLFVWPSQELMGGAFQQDASVDLSRKAMRMEPVITRCQEGITAIERCRKPVVGAFHSGVIGAGWDGDGKQTYPPNEPPRNPGVIRPYYGQPMVNKPLRPYLWGGYVREGGWRVVKGNHIALVHFLQVWQRTCNSKSRPLQTTKLSAYVAVFSESVVSQRFSNKSHPEPFPLPTKSKSRCTFLWSKWREHHLRCIITFHYMTFHMILSFMAKRVKHGLKLLGFHTPRCRFGQCLWHSLLQRGERCAPKTFMQ